MINLEQNENWRNVYDRDGLMVKQLDESAVCVYLEGAPRCEMTLQEWRAVNKALEGME